MFSALRSLVVIVLGFVVAVAIITAVDYFDFKIFPLPLWAHFRDPATVRAAVPLIPAPALAIVLCGWFLGTFAGCWLTIRLAARHHALHGTIVGLFLLAGGIADIAFSASPPAWYWIMGIAVYPAAILMAIRLSPHALQPALH